MRNVKLFIGMSVDGYIAKKDGAVDWMQGHEDGKDDMQSYHEFIKGMDTVILGWNTYHQIATILSPDKWMYEDFMSYVLTHRKLKDTENIVFVNEDVCDLMRRLKQEEGKDIWICGGAGIIEPLVRENLIDTYHISILPIILGEGISLFKEHAEQLELKLVKSYSYNGITDVIYKRRNDVV